MISASWLIGAYFLAVSSHKLGSLNTSFYGCLAWGHPTNFSLWSRDIQYSKLYSLAEILLNFKSVKVH